MLKFNPDTKIIFDNDEAAVAPIREITRDEVADLIANGASVDASANVGEQTSSAAPTAGDVQVAQDPAAPAIGSDTGADAGNAASAAEDTAAAATSGTASVVNSTASADVGNVDTGTSGSAAPVNYSNDPSTTSAVNAGESGSQATGAEASNVDAPEPVVNDAQADPGGAGSADLNPKPAAPNLDAQPASTAASDAVPLAVGGAADSAAEDEEEHPLAIIAEIEALVALVGNAAIHEYQRIIRRLADLKNHPKIKAE